ncbi:MAG TPA: zf-HC2 domain-containing protein [Thermoanaerobaculia bacterium]|jgi:tetratricopeptide (TPR) repeat protein
MNAAELMQTCPDPETLSAFLDQKLDPAARLEVVQHLAECGDCRDLVVAATEYAQEEEASAPTTEVVRGNFGRRRWLAPLVAAAAIAVAGFVGMPWYLNRPMVELMAAENALDERPTTARLSGDYVYKKHPTFRGSGDNRPISDNEEMAELRVNALAGKAEERAEKNPTARNLHTAAVGELLMKKPDIRKVVRELETAAQAKPSSVAIQIDLAAAYLAAADYEQALAAADTAMRIDPTNPAAAWNRALALEYLHHGSEAIAAWKKYLEVDPNSDWAKEAADRRDDLEDDLRNSPNLR